MSEGPLAYCPQHDEAYYAEDDCSGCIEEFENKATVRCLPPVEVSESAFRKAINRAKEMFA